MADFQVTSFANELKDSRGALLTNLFGITNPVMIQSPDMGGKIIIDANKQECRILKCRRWGGAKSGNDKNANWRKVHGGGFCMPLNTKFKSKNSRPVGAMATKAAPKAAA